MCLIKKYKFLFICSAAGLFLSVAVASDLPDMNVFQAFISIEVVILIVYFLCKRKRQVANTRISSLQCSDHLVDQLCSSLDPDFVAFVLLMVKSGISFNQIVNAYRSSHQDSECNDLMLRVQYVSSYYSSVRTLQNLAECDASNYLIISCDDDQLCDLCRKFKGRSFPVSSAKIGYNCPPFHLGCRCNIVISDK